MGIIRSTIGRVNNFQVRALASKTTKKLSPHIRTGESVLDIGCGLGAQALDMQKKTGARVSGIDVIDYAGSDFRPTLFDGEHIPYPDKSFDVSYVAYVLHHAEKPFELLRESIRVSRRLVLILEDTPRNAFDRALDAYHGWSFNKFYKLKNKTIFWTRKEWEQFFEQLGVRSYRAFPLGRFDREVYFPISRTLFVIEV